MIKSMRIIVRNLFFWMLTLLSMSTVLSSCADDAENEEALANDINQKLESMVRETLVGDHLLFTKVTVNGVDKTLLDGGCPTRLNFSWDGDSLVVAITDLKIGNMPFAISYQSTAAIRLLNHWEEDEHAGGNEAWFKFVGTNGYVSMGDGLKPNGASIKGYFHPGDNIIEFVIDYNVMNVRTVCERQVLDDPNVGDFDTEMAKYLEELAKYKRENGLDINVPSYDIDGPIYLDSIPSKGEDRFISLSAVKGMLTDNIVLDANVVVGGTPMAQNVPTIIYFGWTGDVMSVKMKGLSIGNMPFKLSFNCDCTNEQLSADDLNSYSPIWFKFEGNDGVVSSDPAMVSGSNGKVVCYFNPVTMQIALNIDFNVAGANASFPKQVIDFDRIDNYDQEVEDYQKANMLFY